MSLLEPVGNMQRGVWGFTLARYSRKFNLLKKNFIPLFRHEIPLVREVPKLIYNFSFDDIKNLFRIHITARLALAFITVHQADILLKINNRLHRVTVVNLVTASIENQ